MLILTGYILEKTTIPIPQLHAYGFGGDKPKNPTGLPFLLMDFVEGKKWNEMDLHLISAEQSTRFHRHLADFRSQLRHQELPRIGSLSLDGNDNWALDNRALSTDMNGQNSYNLDPSRFVDPHPLFQSTADHIYSLHGLSENRFYRSRNSLYDRQDGKEKVHALEQTKSILFDWIKQEQSHGPFVLIHGDLRPSNIIIDEDFNIKAIIDWEWS
jgi:aminoglycoside phosphotransferase (APT) family kinase protein